MLTIKCYFLSKTSSGQDATLRKTSQREEFYDAWKALKSVFGRGSAPDTAWRAHAPHWGSSRCSQRLPSRLGRRKPPPHSPLLRRLRRLGLVRAFGASDIDAFSTSPWTPQPSILDPPMSRPTFLNVPTSLVCQQFL